MYTDFIYIRKRPLHTCNIHSHQRDQSAIWGLRLKGHRTCPPAPVSRSSQSQERKPGPRGPTKPPSPPPWRMDSAPRSDSLDENPGSVQFSSVAQSCLTLCDPMNRSTHTRPLCPSQTPGIYSNSCPSSQWCHPAIWSSVVPLSSCPQSLPASGSFPMSQLFTWDGQSIGVSCDQNIWGAFLMAQ